MMYKFAHGDSYIPQDILLHPTMTHVIVVISLFLMLQ